MSLQRAVIPFLLAMLLCAPDSSRAECRCCGGGPPDVVTSFPDAEVQLTFERRFTGIYRPGEPCDVVTVAPNGAGESFAAAGIRLRLRLFCSEASTGADLGPISDLPPEQIVLFSSSLCMCSWLFADVPTDSKGWTEFSGTLHGGGCATSLTLFVDGVGVVTLPIKTNSPDTGTASACSIDQSDLAALATALGQPAHYSICYDYNESGIVDTSDLAYFAAVLGAQCQ